MRAACRIEEFTWCVPEWKGTGAESSVRVPGDFDARGATSRSCRR